ncbi:EamA family transporter [Ornithinicoccus hortensis]|uniref:Threonine/homoserine efflux transporter RhtA n=1 Tax=Ornithinicoccus hortensis TaxID=82346 RepID=A0A542YM30_9MICO|nr:DMT family transporter [Ornithinicoccus hortensis]TQL49149.1 threonine/homoserine efflux transporter RhtA [Ornithinicoccus hortensis]
MDRRIVSGLLLALASGAAFGTSGAFAKGLLEAGWSPGAAVTWRVATAALVMLVPAVLMMRGKWHRLRHGWPSIVVFGVVAVAGCQLAYFLAVERLSVAVALLLEYLGIILVVGWLWLRHGERPRPLTVLGAGISIVGLMLMLDVFGAVQVDPVGVLWGLVAATGLATYFLVSADESHGLPALVVASGGLGVGAIVLVLAGALGVVPMTWNTGDVQLAGMQVPWWADVAALGVIAAAFAYASGVMSIRRLGSKLASFVGLTEVMFAVLWAWLLLSELPAPVQLVGGALILAGVVAVKLDERPAVPTEVLDLPEQGPALEADDLSVEPVPH